MGFWTNCPEVFDICEYHIEGIRDSSLTRIDLLLEMKKVVDKAKMSEKESFSPYYHSKFKRLMKKILYQNLLQGKGEGRKKVRSGHCSNDWIT